MMRHFPFALTILAVLLSACSSPSDGGGNATPTTGSSLGGTQPADSDTATRTALISELKNEVEARTTSEAAYQVAAEGEQILAGGGVKTGDEARVRIDTSEGSIIRVAANTEFTLMEFSPQADDPVTKLQLEAGKIWIWVTKALGSGAFEIETPGGTATVRGSLMSIQFDRDTRRTLITCLEGQCRLGDRAGNFTDLTEGQQTEIPGEGQRPLGAGRMTREQLQDWFNNFPEVREIVARLLNRLQQEATPTPSGGAGGGLTACDHPYFPLRPGATWSYSTNIGDQTWTVDSVSGDASNAEAVVTMAFSGGQVTWHWQCTPDGIVSYDFGVFDAASFGQILEMNVTNSSGVWLPSADRLAVGYSWSNSYQIETQFNMPNAPAGLSGSTSVTENSTVISLEPVTLGGQQFDAVHITVNQETTTKFSLPGVPAQEQTISSATTYVLARGVGMVSSVSDDGSSQLTQYTVP